MPFAHTNDSGTFFGALISIAVNGFFADAMLWLDGGN